ncbi:hypothetical protein A2572_03470 [Candidatus Collierbacteria bacterium RIFOXYD1_FULL_40_9]|uniref:Big-1 domain-containing protein n=1 Tax=Candidatus Collierbacteria bacterium RIFOXYD1_FULL_40_9 TaxID=1817731 RepID=A0A1F5FX50_9BACT|nr:MAG: hypothetical protein A2572_03470 [Candidatus Collierbacteria bacterium RIFOXYD1_FULL_40_9]
MAAPTYTTDLSNINTAENTGTWSEFSTYTIGGTPVTNETDYFIQGTQCTSATMTKSGLGSIAVDNGSGVTVPTDGAILVWQYFSAPNSLAAETAGGFRILIGADITNFNGWIVGGSDFSPNPYGGWNNVAVNPTVTADYTAGTGNGGTYRWIASGINATGAISKGNPHGVDAIRYGRCEARFSDGESGNPATFTGYATTNDSVTNRYGLIQAIAGGFKVKGLIIFGYSTAVYFSDSNKTILIDNTKKVTANFNTFEVRQSGSTIILSAVNITALGTVSLGRWVTTDNATQTITSCTFTSMGTFGYASNSTITTSTYRTCGLITQNSATFTGCTFASSTSSASILSNNPGLISGCSFTSDGSNHALEISTAGTYAFNSNNFTGYATIDGSTGNEVIYNNSGGAVTLNVSTSGTGTISVRNGASASTTVNNTVTVTITVKDQVGDVIPGVQVAIFQDNSARTVVLASTTTNASGQVSTSVAANLGAIIIRARQSTETASFLTSESTSNGIESSTEQINFSSNHNFQTGDAVTYSRNGGSIDIGPEPGTFYINAVDADTVMLYDTAANAISGGATGKQALTASGAETHKLDPIRYISSSATGTIGSTAFTAQITMLTDTIATG